MNAISDAGAFGVEEPPRETRPRADVREAHLVGHEEALLGLDLRHRRAALVRVQRVINAQR